MTSFICQFCNKDLKTKQSLNRHTNRQFKCGNQASITNYNSVVNNNFTQPETPNVEVCINFKGSSMEEVYQKIIDFVNINHLIKAPILELKEPETPRIIPAIKPEVIPEPESDTETESDSDSESEAEPEPVKKYSKPVVKPKVAVENKELSPEQRRAELLDIMRTEYMAELKKNEQKFKNEAVKNNKNDLLTKKYQKNVNKVSALKRLPKVPPSIIEKEEELPIMTDEELKNKFLEVSDMVLKTRHNAELEAEQHERETEKSRFFLVEIQKLSLLKFNLKKELNLRKIKVQDIDQNKYQKKKVMIKKRQDETSSDDDDEDNYGEIPHRR